MRDEHCTSSDSQEVFTPSNYGVSTTPEKEYLFTTAPETLKSRFGSIPKEDPEKMRQHRARTPDARERQVMSQKQMRETMDRLNGRLQKLGTSGAAGSKGQLTIMEVWGAHLYTGPCFMQYNSVLRMTTGIRKLQADWEELCRGNMYTTSLHVINSCIVKIARLSEVGCVYRGVKGGVVPDKFMEPDEIMGCPGGIDFSFMSTSRDRNVALSYTEGSQVRVVFEIAQGLIDRGADLREISQYPHEQEILSPLWGSNRIWRPASLRLLFPLGCSARILGGGQVWSLFWAGGGWHTRRGFASGDRGASEREPSRAHHRAGGREAPRDAAPDGTRVAD